MAPIKFYYDLISQPSRALYIFLKMSKIPFDGFPIALRKGVHLTDEYRQNINRFQKVPALVDNTFQLSESIAIFRYLAAKEKCDDHWYPLDLQKRGRIDEYLEWQHSNTRTTCSYYFILKYLKPRMAGKAPDDEYVAEASKKQMNETLDTIENLWLPENNKFIGGLSDVSIADLFGACEIEQPRITGYDPGIGRPKLTNWIKLVKEKTNPYYDEAHQIVDKLIRDNSDIPEYFKGIHTSLWLQILLFLNAYFTPIWIATSVYYFWSQQLIIPPVEEILTITALFIGASAEISRLYFGYSGNLREQIPDLATFWILTSFVRLPIQCYLIFAKHNPALTISFTIQTISGVFILLQIFMVFFVIRDFSKTRAKQFRLETLIKQQNNVSLKAASRVE